MAPAAVFAVPPRPAALPHSLPRLTAHTPIQPLPTSQHAWMLPRTGPPSVLLQGPSLGVAHPASWRMSRCAARMVEHSRGTCWAMGAAWGSRTLPNPCWMHPKCRPDWQAPGPPQPAAALLPAGTVQMTHTHYARCPPLTCLPTRTRVPPPHPPHPPPPTHPHPPHPPPPTHTPPRPPTPPHPPPPHTHPTHPPPPPPPHHHHHHHHHHHPDC